MPVSHHTCSTFLHAQAHEVMKMVGHKVRVTTDTAHELHTLIKPYVDSADDGGAASMWCVVLGMTQAVPRCCHVLPRGGQQRGSTRHVRAPCACAHAWVRCATHSRTAWRIGWGDAAGRHARERLCAQPLLGPAPACPSMPSPSMPHDVQQQDPKPAATQGGNPAPNGAHFPCCS